MSSSHDQETTRRSSETSSRVSTTTSVSFTDLKYLAEKHLEASSILRSLIIAEPDYLPREVVLAKLVAYAMLLYDELGKR
jgi:hypothetical protein